MTDTASLLAPLPVAAGLLPSAPRDAAASARRPGLVGARSRSVSFGVGLGLGARRRHLEVASAAAGQPIRPPQEWAPGRSIEVLEADGLAVPWTPWQVSDHMAAPAIRGLLSTQRDAVVEPRRHRPPTTAATSHRPERSLGSVPVSSAGPASPQPAAPAVPAITADNQIDFADTGHEAGSRGDMLSKLAQLNHLRDGAPPRSASAPSSPAQPPHSSPTLVRQPTEPYRRSAVTPIGSTATPIGSAAISAPGATSAPAAGSPGERSLSAPGRSPRQSPASTAGPIAVSPREFVEAWEARPAPVWPDLTPYAAPGAPAGAVADAGPSASMSPAAAAALEALRASNPAAPSLDATVSPARTASVTAAAAANASTSAAASPRSGSAPPQPASTLDESPPAWPGDMAPGEGPVRSARAGSDIVAATAARASVPESPQRALAEPVRARLTDDGKIDFGETGHDHGSQGDMLSKLAQLENLRNPSRPAPRRATTPEPGDPAAPADVTSPGSVSSTVPPVSQPLVERDQPSVPGSADESPDLAWPGDEPQADPPSATPSALARALAPIAAPEPLSRSPRPQTGAAVPQPDVSSAPVVPDAAPASPPNAPITSAITPTPQLRRDMAPDASPVSTDATFTARPTPVGVQAPASAAQTARVSPPAGSPPADSASVPDGAGSATMVAPSAAPTIDGATAPPLAVRFLHELRSRQRVETEALPMAFRPLADEIAGTVPVTIATGLASRRALDAVGRPAATVGSIIHLAERPRDDERSHQILAHELTHVAEPSALPRFFDDPIVTAEEREARRAEKVVRRAIRDTAAPASAARGRSVGGAIPATDRSTSGGTAADVIRRTPAASSGSTGTPAQSLAEQIQGGGSVGTASTISRSSSGSSGGSGTDVVRRSSRGSTANARSSSDPTIQRAAEDTDDSQAVQAEHLDMDAIVREVERRLTKKLIGERIRRGQSFRGRI